MKNKKVLIPVLGFVILLVLMVFLNSFNNDEGSLSDALRFKNDYEELNGKLKSDGSPQYSTISIDKDNPIKYVSVKKMLDVLDKDEAIIYVGAPWCPWCRRAIPILLEVAESYNIDTIYYLNLDEDKSIFEVKDGKAVKTKDGSKDYYKLLEKLSDILEDYSISDNGESYETGEKRIYNPSVYAVKDGKVVSNHVGTVTLNSGQTSMSELTSEQHDELYSVYENMIKQVYGDNSSVCAEGESCD